MTPTLIAHRYGRPECREAHEAAVQEFGERKDRTGYARGFLEGIESYVNAPERAKDLLAEAAQQRLQADEIRGLNMIDAALTQAVKGC